MYIGNKRLNRAIVIVLMASIYSTPCSQGSITLQQRHTSYKIS